MGHLLKVMDHCQFTLGPHHSQFWQLMGFQRPTAMSLPKPDLTTFGAGAAPLTLGSGSSGGDEAGNGGTPCLLAYYVLYGRPMACTLATIGETMKPNRSEKDFCSSSTIRNRLLVNDERWIN